MSALSTTVSRAVLSLTMVLSFNLSSVAEASFIGKFEIPDGPNAEKTPGDLCKYGRPRYSQKITYCERNVSSSTKQRIIAEYDVELGYEIRQLPRGDFKIDHFIPLSIGGSNDEKNLWPQHKSVYKFTDPIESHVANLIANNRISQADAIQAVKDCKLNLPKCKDVEDYLRSLY